MDWNRQIDGYCERIDFSFWSEPVNAITNAGFVVAAAWMWQRCAGVTMARVLCVILFTIGIGSFLFHSYATQWAALADVVPIGVFILLYLFLVNRDVVGMKGWQALLATALFFPYAALLVPVLDRIPFLRVSDFYWTVPILLFVYGALLRKRVPQTARGLVIGGLILCVSISLRSVDEALCDHVPIGTHFLWHVLNAVMLGWMIETYRRHQVPARRHLNPARPGMGFGMDNVQGRGQAGGSGA
ncbi:hypothetical protein E4Z66_12240 [Aliishimia ponticola]|uniref:Ceramidase n=1 Tax=Aliishimia ponticola TaxID=2499833 RepID=A0A4S4N9C3_9RHOB|nr:ceramidase domain-containing protein [Aliishimia ponticola]THH35842.1 hypothetical protein E4Z66_12240 [Aliishimia ponticola]